MKTRSIIPLLCATMVLAVGCADDPLQPTDSTPAFKPFTASTVPSTTDPPSSTTMVQRPISDFISTQGTYCMPSSASDCWLYSPPVPNMVVWHLQQHNMTLVVDYAGLMDAWLRSHATFSYGTSFDGAIYEEPLSDGRARVTIDLKAMNVMAYMVQGTDLANGPVRFGYKVTDLVDQKYSAALGHATMRITFTRGAMGRPIPDLVQLLKTPRPDDQAVMSAFHFDGVGEFHNEFGQVSKAQIVVDGSGPLMAGYPGMEHATAPMGYANMQMMPIQ
jgi:hypothetical protein